MRQIPNIRGNTYHHQKMTTMVNQSSPAFSHPWRTPVPYLFGGLAAMLGLIAFALLLLACSYWKLSRRSDDGDDLAAGDGEKQRDSGEKAAAKIYEEKILVIMAGQNKPTFLATPVAAKICVDCVISSSGGIVVNMESKEGQNGESKEIEASSSFSDEGNH